MTPRDDSGMIPLTRDGGYKMIHAEIEKFEGNVWVPAVKELKEQITTNNKDLTGKIDANSALTNGVFLSVERFKWVFVGFSSVVSVLAFFWLCIQFYDRVKGIH